MLNDLIGKPYVLNDHGTVGYDCYTLAMEVTKRLGIDIPEFTAQENSEANAKLIADNQYNFTKLSGPQDYCLVGLSVVPGITSHVGVVLEWPKFIHITKAKHVVIERLDSPMWKTRVRGYFL